MKSGGRKATGVEVQVKLEVGQGFAEPRFPKPRLLGSEDFVNTNSRQILHKDNHDMLQGSPT